MYLAFAEATSLYTVNDEESIDEELKKLELDMGCENLHEPNLSSRVNSAGKTEASDSADSLIDSLYNLKLVDDGQARIPAVEEGTAETKRNKKTERSELQIA